MPRLSSESEPAVLRSAVASSRTRPRERGAYVILLVLGSCAILCFFAMVFDVARLYLVAKQLQVTVDATALATARLLVMNPNLDVATAKDHGAEILRRNLELMRAPNPNLTYGAAQNGYTIEIPNTKESVMVGAALQVPTFLIQILPGVSNLNTVARNTTVNNLKLEIVMVLDASDSMLQPISSPPAGSGCATKFCAAKFAANRFVDMLLPLDRAAVVSFGTTDSPETGTANGDYKNDAKIEYPCREYAPPVGGYPAVPASCPSDPFVSAGAAGSPERVNLKSAVELFRNYGATNTGAGLSKARDLFAAAGPTPPNTERIVLLMTDGNPYMGIKSLPYWVGGALAYLSDTDIPGRGHRLDPGCFNNHLLDINQIFCEAVFPYSGCDTYRRWDPIVARRGKPSLEGEERRRLDTVDAIIEADALRDEGVTIYTIGLGTPDTSTQFTVFQDGLDDLVPPDVAASGNYGAEHADRIKQMLLIRLANEQGRMLAPPDTLLPSPAPSPRDYYWDYPCVARGNALTAKPQGSSIIADSGPALVSAFETIATEIRTRFGS